MSNIHDKSISFLTIGDRNFFDTIYFSRQQASKLYPNADFYIYDWGFTPEQTKKLNSIPNTVILPWEIQQLKLDIGFYTFRKKITMGIPVFLRKNSLPFFRKKYLDNCFATEGKLVNKVLCYQDFISKFKRNFIFLDGDAFLINRLDDSIGDNFDIGVTIRRQSEVNYKKGECAVLNSGVLFFMGGYEKNKSFVERWKKQMLQTHEYLIEQSSLTRMIQKFSPHKKVLVNKTVSVAANKQTIKVHVLSCENYNFNWVEEGIDKKKVKIVHLKSGRFDSKQLPALLNNFRI